MSQLTTEQWIEELKGISVVELSERIQALEETFGVSAQQQVAVQPEGVEEAAEPEPETFDVVITETPEKRVPVMKIIRGAGITLGDAKKLMDDLPATIQEQVDQQTADKWKADLEKAGATVELR